MLEQIKAFVKDGHIVVADDKGMVLAENSDQVKMKVHLLTKQEPSLGLKIENCHSSMIRRMQPGQYLAKYNKLRACCDYIILTRDLDSWHVLLVEMVKNLANAFSEDRQKLEQLACSKPLVNYLLSVADLVTVNEIPRFSFQYHLLYHTIGFRSSYPIGKMAHEMHGHPRNVIVHRPPGNAQTGFFQYGSPTKHIHVITRKVGFDEKIHATTLIKDYRQSLESYGISK